MKLGFDILKEKAALITERDNLKTNNIQLTENVTALNTTIGELKAKADDYEKTIAAFPLAKQDWEKEVAEMKQTHVGEIEKLNATITELTEKLSKEKNSVAVKVSNELSAIGINEGLVAQTVETKNADAILKEMDAAPDLKSKQKIFQQHKEMLLKEAGVDLSRW